MRQSKGLLAISLCLSVLWHVFCIFNVELTFPDKLDIGSYHDSLYLGPIIDKFLVFKTSGVSKKFIDYDLINAHKGFFLKHKQKLEKLSNFASTLKSDNIVQFASYKISKPLFFNIEDINASLPSLLLKESYPNKDVMLENKNILFGYSIPKEQFEAPGYVWPKVEVKFLLSPYGRVIFAEVLTSSGDINADLNALRSLRKWMFYVSLDDNGTYEEKIVFNLENDKN